MFHIKVTIMNYEGENTPQMYQEKGTQSRKVEEEQKEGWSVSTMLKS